MDERTWPSSGAQLEGHPRAQLLTSSLCWPPLPGATCTGTASSECRGKTASGEMDNSPTRPVLPRLHHCPPSHGALPPCHQLWDIVTPLPTWPVLFMELLTQTAPTVAGDRWNKVIKSLKEHSRGQTAPPSQAGTSLSCTCHGHTKEPGLEQLHATPAAEKAPGKRNAPLSPVPAGPSRASQHNLLSLCHQGMCKDPWPQPQRTAPLQPHAPDSQPCSICHLPVSWGWSPGLAWALPVLSQP